jgi:hypothetical protein
MNCFENPYSDVNVCFNNGLFMTCFVQADAGASDEVLGHWKCGFAQADKAEMILSALCTDSHHKVVGSNGNCLKGVLALSPWGLSAALWNLVLLLRHHRECRLKPDCITVSIEDDQVCMIHIIWQN